MERTRYTDDLSIAVNEAVAPLMISPNIEDHQKLEPHIDKLQHLLDKIRKTHHIPALHRRPLTNYTTSKTIFDLYHVARFIYNFVCKDQKSGYEGDIYVVRNNNRLDLIFEYSVTWTPQGYERNGDEITIHQWFSLQKKSWKPKFINSRMKDEPYNGDLKIKVTPRLDVIQPHNVLLVYDDYIEVADLGYNNHLSEIRPLRASEAIEMLKGLGSMNLEKTKIMPDPNAFPNIVFMEEEPRLRLMWRPFTKKVTIDVNKIKYKHIVHPDLVFFYKGGTLFTYILMKDYLYQVPYMNVSNNGNICMGLNTNITHGNMTEVMHKLEEIFFHTRFTHVSNSGYSNDEHMKFIKNEYEDFKFKTYMPLWNFLNITKSTLKYGEEDDIEEPDDEDNDE